MKFSSVMDMFRGAPAPDQVQQQQQANQQQQASQTTNGLPVQQPNPAADQTKVPEANVSPLDAFKNVWDNTPKDGQSAEPSFDPATAFRMDPEKLRQATAQVDFTKNLNPADLQAIVQGGEGAVAALANVLNHATREALNTSLAASAGMLQQGFTQAVPAMDQRISKQVIGKAVSSQLQELNPALNHPATAPILEAVKENLIRQNPRATPKEIADMAADFLNNFATVIQAPQSQQAASQQPSGTNWDKYYTGSN